VWCNPFKTQLMYELDEKQRSITSLFHKSLYIFQVKYNRNNTTNLFFATWEKLTFQARP